MKKNFYFFAMISMFFVYELFSVVEKGKTEPFKTAQEVKKPETWQEAGEFEKRYEETQKEIRDPEEYKKTIEELKIKVEKASDKDKTLLDREIQQRQTQYDAYKKASIIFEDSGVKDLIESYKKELASEFEPVKPEKPIEPEKSTEEEKLPLGTAIAKTLASWIAEGRARIYEFFGNKEAVKAIREDLDKVYGEFGESGLLSKARNNARLARTLKDLKERLDKNRQALSEYKDALEKGTVDQKIKDEIRETVVDLLQLRQAIKEREFTAQERNILNKEITETLNAFDISQEEQKQLENDAQETHQKKIDDLTKRIEQRSDSIENWAVNNVAAYNTFRKDLGELIRLNIDNLPSEQQGAINLLIRESLRKPSDALWNELVKPDLSEDRRGIMLDRYFKVNADYLNAEKRYGEWYSNFLEKYGKEALGLKEKPLPDDYPNLVKKSLIPLTDRVVKNLATPLDYYNQLTKQVENFEKYMQDKAVSPSKLTAEQIILTDVFGKIINAIKDQSLLEGVSTDQLVSVLLKATQKSENIGEQINYDQVATIVESPEGVLEQANPAPPAPRAPNEPFKANIKKNVGAFKKKAEAEQPDKRQVLLNSIRERTVALREVGKKLPEKPSGEVKGLGNVISEAMAKRRIVIKEEEFEVEENEEDWN